MREARRAHHWLHLYDSPESTGEKIMTQNGNGFSIFAKGLFVGSILGAAATLLFASRNRTGLHSDIPQEGVRYERRHRPLPPARVEKINETGEPVKRSIGWSVIFYFASAVAMIANLRIKKI